MKELEPLVLELDNGELGYFYNLSQIEEINRQKWIKEDKLYESTRVDNVAPIRTGKEREYSRNP